MTSPDTQRQMDGASTDTGGGTESASDALPSEPTGIPEVMTVDEVAAFARVNRNNVYGCIRRGELAVCRCGRIIRVHHDAVLDWLRGNARVSRSSRRKR